MIARILRPTADSCSISGGQFQAGFGDELAEVGGGIGELLEEGGVGLLVDRINAL